MYCVTQNYISITIHHFRRHYVKFYPITLIRLNQITALWNRSCTAFILEWFSTCIQFNWNRGYKISREANRISLDTWFYVWREDWNCKQGDNRQQIYCNIPKRRHSFQSKVRQNKGDRIKGLERHKWARGAVNV